MRTRLRTVRIIALRGFKSALYGFGLYIIGFLGCALAAMILRGYVHGIVGEGLLISPNPLNAVVYFAVVISTIYLAIAATTAITRERDSGTLQELFYGPVDVVSYILAKYLEQILVFAILMTFYYAVVLIFAGMMNFPSSWQLALLALLSFAAGSSVTSFGVLLSSLTNRIRTSILLLLAIFALFILIPWAESLIVSMVAESTSPLLHYAASLIAILAGLLEYISPFSFLRNGISHMELGNMAGVLQSLVLPFIYTAIMLATAVTVMKKKGVRRQT